MSDDSAALFDQAVRYQQQGMLTEALSLWDMLVQRKPPFAQVYANHGQVCLELGRPADALASFQTALTFSPGDADIRLRQGIALQRLGRADDALAAYGQALTADPLLAQAYYNRGTVQQERGQLEEALASYDRALEISPDLAWALCNRAGIFRGRKQLDRALQDFDRAIICEPDNPVFHTNRAFCLLLKGDFAEGWREMEWRQRYIPAVSGAAPQTPPWRGEDLAGKSLLIRAEQGLGDTMMFCRYASAAAARGANVTLAVHDELLGLMQSFDPAVSVTGTQKPLAAFDYQIRMLSMPLHCQTGSQNIPAGGPYLSAEPERARMWQQRLGATGFKIGIAWQGEGMWLGKKKPIDIGRSLPLTAYAGLAAIPSVRLISLQKHEGAEQLENLPAGMTVESLGADFDSGAAFLDTAAVMQHLDLVITSDTAIAHLAGALGRPVWLALQFVPEWRWLLEGDNSPWYPTMRLFRQSAPGDWAGVFARIEKELRTIASDAQTGG